MKELEISITIYESIEEKQLKDTVSFSKIAALFINNTMT